MHLHLSDRLKGTCETKCRLAEHRGRRLVILHWIMQEATAASLLAHAAMQLAAGAMELIVALPVHLKLTQYVMQQRPHASCILLYPLSQSIPFALQVPGSCA